MKGLFFQEHAFKGDLSGQPFEELSIQNFGNLTSSPFGLVMSEYKRRQNRIGLKM